METGAQDRAEHENRIGRTLDALRQALEADPLLPSPEICRRLDAIADEVLALFDPEPAPPASRVPQ